MILSNIKNNNVIISNEPGAFFKVKDSLYEYAKMMSDVLPNEDGKGGADHFVSTVRAIEALKNALDNGDCGDDDALHQPGCAGGGNRHNYS